MSSRRQIAASLALTLAVVLMPLVVPAQTPPAGAPYRPGVGDLMTMTVQPRHLKVGLAGLERNWAYLAYGLHELEEALEHVAKASPKWRNLDLAALIASSTKEPIEALEEAVKVKDAARFDAAYARLTAACNACHQSANVGMVVIQAPKTSPFTNQDFRPAKP